MSAQRFKHLITAFALLGFLSVTGAAQAHAHLESQLPAADSAVTSPKELRLQFSEGVEEKFSKVTITSTTPGGKTLVEAAPSVATDPADNKTLIVTPAAPLAPGTYKIEWHAVSVDTHKSEGTYSFSVSP